MIYSTQTEYLEKTQIQDTPETRNTVYRCPYKFSGPNARQELRHHLAISGIDLKKSSFKMPLEKDLQCPVYYFNEQDAIHHIQVVAYNNQQRENDFKVFWDLIKSEEEEKELREKKKEKNKKAKRRTKESKQKKKRESKEKERIQKEKEEKNSIRGDGEKKIRKAKTKRTAKVSKGYVGESNDPRKREAEKRKEKKEANRDVNSEYCNVYR